MTDETNTDTPRVSVVIPTCNRRKEIAKCLKSLAAQTHPSFEIIIVDDHSTDGTPELLAEFQTEHPEIQVRWLYNEQHRGANPSRNRGVTAARGTLIAFADSDCVANSDWLLHLEQAFDSPNVAAVVGEVNDPPPRNIFDLTFRGTHKVTGTRHANRLVGCNMCVRRELLEEHAWDEDRGREAKHADGTPDVTVSGRGDEEGLYLMLKAAGYEVRVARDAVVLHEHYYSARSFFKQAYRGGAAAARLVYKYHLPPRLDLLPFMLAYATLPLGLITVWMLLMPAFFIAAGLAAITYNDLFRKRKSLLQTAVTFPVLIVYYHARLAGFLMQIVRLWCGRDRLKRIRIRDRAR